MDDTSATSLYLTDDSVASTLNNLAAAGKIAVSSAALPFPRPIGVPQILHGDGSPEGLVFAPQGSMYMRRDNTGATSSLYVKTSGITSSTDWQAISTATIAVPTGVVHAYAAAVAPTDWLLCDGAAVSRSLFSGLFGIIGTVYGDGDGSTTFNVPDMRGRVPAGYAASGGHPDVSTLGYDEQTALASRRPRHKHSVGDPSISINDPGHGHSVQNLVLSGNDILRQGGTLTDNNRSTGSSTTGITASASGGTVGPQTGAPSDAPAYLVINFIIKT